MKKNNIKETLNEGKVIINGWLSIPNSFSAELMANEDWDSLTLDLQHGLIDYSSSISMLQAISSSSKTPLARVPWNEPGIIMKMLDLGVLGIICPMINSKKECQEFVSYCKYPPLGNRSFGPMRAQLNYGLDYSSNANDEILSIAMIETKQAVENLEEILSTKGLDGIYVGPSDLSFSYTNKPSFDIKNSPVFEKIKFIVDQAKKNKIFAGIHVGSSNYALDMISIGYQFISFLNEAKIMSAGIKKFIGEIKGVKKETSESVY